MYCASCGGDYSRKDKSGDCGRCFILNQLEAKHGVESEEYKSASMRSQCLSCGACVRHLKDNLCGKCRGGSLVLPEDQPRREQFSHQMAQGRAKRRLDHSIPPVGGNQAAMLLGGQPGPNSIYGPAASILHPQGSYNNFIPPVPLAVQSSSQPLPPPPMMPLTTQALNARRQTLDGSGIQYQSSWSVTRYAYSSQMLLFIQGPISLYGQAGAAAAVAAPKNFLFGPYLGPNFGRYVLLYRFDRIRRPQKQFGSHARVTRYANMRSKPYSMVA
ncbi:hypothetical protein BDZ89DRAFT_1052580 [Hymenopellis radicata]|nr:hypothetical protein BDZ89DRAFT_1052580 [Hymenopellis radicata]